MLIHPQFDPVAIHLGPLAVRWYGLMYLVGFALLWALGRYAIKTRKHVTLTAQDLDDALFYGIIGVIAGEFVVSGAGIGHAIAFAYNSFDNRMMYGLIVLLFVLVGSVNMLLSLWEHKLYARRAGR